MPELPDVEVFKNYVNATALHRTVKTVRVVDDRILSGVSRRTLQRRLKGRELLRTRRHGKHLFAKIAGDGWLMLHFGMTGSVQFFKKNDKRPHHTQLEIAFVDGSRLLYDSRRLLGKIGLTKHPKIFATEKNLGPDAMDELGPKAFQDLVSGRKGMIKSALVNQRLLAGIGNEYADEILFQARLDPETRVEELGGADLDRIYRSMLYVFEKAVEAKANPKQMPETFLLPRRREGAICPRCGGHIEKVKTAGRNGYKCDNCQKGPE